jgi:hypothetical protein
VKGGLGGTMPEETNVAETQPKGIHAIVEIIDRLLSKPLPEKWGNWKLDRDKRAIYYDGPHEYWFSLGQMNSSAEVLDWIVQLHEQRWATPEDIGNLVAALDDIFDLQNNLCGCGIEHRFNAREHVDKLFPEPPREPATNSN